ncbi:MAG: ATP-binding protein, partial [Syntrophales bacterium]|nr:ATP-binding protein [Syntrophales bacterium]
LAAVSLIIAISLIIYKKNDPVQLSFAALCLAIFVNKTGFFFHGIFRNDFMKFFEYAGFISIPPLLIRFSRHFLKNQTFFLHNDVASTSLFGLALAIIFFTPLYRLSHFHVFLFFYMVCVCLLCYLSLINYIKKASGVEKKRTGYLAIACPVAAALSAFDFFHYYGYGFPPLSNLVISALLYFMLLIIAYPHLTELHELMAKALFISIITAFTVVLFYLVIGLFGKGTGLSFTHVLMACFVIVISISPFKIILEKISSALYPESKDVFTSLYALDTKLEKERALLLEEMAPVFAHEIRNPLGSIKGAAQYLRSETGAMENRRLLDIIIEEVDRLNSVVSQFLDYAKPHMVNLKTQNINYIIDRVISLIKTNNMLGNIVIETDLNPDMPDIAVDGDQIIQVILNIVFNAMDAMPGGGTLTIKTSKIESETGTAVGISIRDTGKGIKREDMRNIFKPFFTTKERGVGLGLAICRRIIKNHGGHIRMKSISGQGTVFYIRLEDARAITKALTGNDYAGKNLTAS